jgi:hypothetical protein
MIEIQFILARLLIQNMNIIGQILLYLVGIFIMVKFDYVLLRGKIAIK